MKFRRPKQSVNTNERRRPATGSSSVFSYYARGNSPSSQNTGRRDEAAKPRRQPRYKFNLRHIPSYVALAAIIIALLNACLLQPNPKIILLNTPGTIHRDPATYQQAVLDIWKQSLFSRTKLTVSTGNIRRAIENRFSELSSVQIELPLLGRRPTVVLVPAAPALRLASNNGVYYVDATGKAMAKAAEVTENELKDVPLVQDETGTSAEPGKTLLPGAEATFLKKLSQQLLAQGLAVQSITLPAGAANEADVRLAGQQYYIKFSIGSDLQQAVGTYLAAKAKLDGEHITPSEYIDVRVEEKVFYK